MEEMKTVCINPWCKATFRFTEEDMIVVDNGTRNSKIDSLLDEEVQKIEPKVCKKCQSFNNELSNGVEWKDKEYEGDRFDGKSHQFRYKVTNYKL
jgi:hypothetical protein